MAIDIGFLKAKLRATWIAGDFGQIAKAYTEGAVEFVDRLELRPGQTVLDVACGTGNSALPAARSGAVVTGVDIAPNLIEQARENAAREGLSIDFEVGDAEQLAFPAASFDAVITMFGAMFAPRPPVVAAEMLRVCRPGGFVAMANWTPNGFVGQTFAIVAKHFPPPPGVPPPVLWGVEETVRERFGANVSNLQITRQNITFSFPFSPEEVVEHFRNFFGPMQVAFDALDVEGQAAMRHDLEQLWIENSRFRGGNTEGESEYLSVVATKRS
jgi:ubiquinone/menaquinone biosynthesis C-methylase UbiE